MKKVDELLVAGKATALEILEQVALEELDEAVAALRRHRPADEVCGALRSLIAASPLAHFQALSAVYRKHCG
jgi:hypothetical protein